MLQTKPRGSHSAPFFLRLVTPAFLPHKVVRIRPAPKSTFVLSTGRTGTVYVADLLNQLDGVVALHEPKPSRVLNAWTTAFLEGVVSTDFMATVLIDKRRKILKNVQADLYIEANNFIAGFADVLEQVFESPTVIHIVRDPRDFTTSLTNRGDDAGVRLLFNKFVPYWAYVPKGVKKRELTALSRAAHRWVAINNYLGEYGRTHKNYHFFRFEDVFDKHDPRKLTPLLRAIGLSSAQIAKLDFTDKTMPRQSRFSLLDRPATSANVSKHQSMQPWREWSIEEKRIFENICGSLMREYGYGGEPEWSDPLQS